jgi:hypothetical protein
MRPYLEMLRERCREQPTAGRPTAGGVVIASEHVDPILADDVEAPVGKAA